MLPIHNISGIILAAGASERMGMPKANLTDAGGRTLLSMQVETLTRAGIKKIAVVVGAHSAEIREMNAGLDMEWVENRNWQTGQFSSIQAGLRRAVAATAAQAGINFLDDNPRGKPQGIRPFLPLEGGGDPLASSGKTRLRAGGEGDSCHPCLSAGRLSPIPLPSREREYADGLLILPVDTAGISENVFAAIIEAALLNPHLDAIIPEHDGRRGHPVFLSAGFGRELLKLDPREPGSRLDLLLCKERKKLFLPVSDPNIMNNLNTIDEWERCNPSPF